MSAVRPLLLITSLLPTAAFPLAAAVPLSLGAPLPLAAAVPLPLPSRRLLLDLTPLYPAVPPAPPTLDAAPVCIIAAPLALPVIIVTAAMLAPVGLAAFLAAARISGRPAEVAPAANVLGVIALPVAAAVGVMAWEGVGVSGGAAGGAAALALAGQLLLLPVRAAGLGDLVMRAAGRPPFVLPAGWRPAAGASAQHRTGMVRWDGAQAGMAHAAGPPPKRFKPAAGVRSINLEVWDASSRHCYCSSPAAHARPTQGKNNRSLLFFTGPREREIER